MPYYFFHATRVASTQITDLFDFVWPTAAALWNLRWQVSGFLKEVGNATPTQLNDRFVFGSNIHGTNLKRACIDTSWDEQKENLAAIVLTNAFSIYEHWADEILTSVGLPTGKGRSLQFDDQPKKPGLLLTVQSICSSESKIMKSTYYSVFTQSKKYSWPLMKSLLLSYRYFKELRNAQIHNGGLGTPLAEESYRAFAPFANKAALGMRGELIHDPIASGQKTRLHLRGVVGFCDILLRMMVTVDAELCRSLPAETILERYLRAARQHSTFSGKPTRRRAQVLGLCRAAGLPPPNDVDAMRSFIVRRGLMRL
jgi:hypothetical protein